MQVVEFIVLGIECETEQIWIKLVMNVKVESFYGFILFGFVGY